MNNIDMLTAALTAEPNNTIIQAMLVDELMEAKDMTATEARQHTAKVIAVAAHAAVVISAAQAIAEGSRHRDYLFKVIRNAAGLHKDMPLNIILIANMQNPIASPPHENRHAATWGIANVVVGAGWLKAQTEARSR